MFFASRVRGPYDRGAVRTAIALVLVAGCASPMSAVKDDNRRLSQTVTELRADRRAQDRKLRDLQRQLDQVRAQIVTSALDGAPALPVEVATPTQSAPTGRVVGVTDDGAEIVYEGDAAAGKTATIDDDPPPRRSPRREPPPIIEVSRPVAARAAHAPVRDRDPAPERGSDAGAGYRIAVDLVKAGKHADAVAALRGFLAKHPHHDYADNAQYWLGEAFYAQKDYTHALLEFRNVIETYPRGNKVPDALLKVGYCYQALGQPDKSRAVLEQVVNLYPKTEPAAIAARRLESP
jgi:tol-pal system protein YbgF